MRSPSFVCHCALLFAAILVARSTLAATHGATKHEPILGGPCEGCEWIFEGMPDSLAWSSRIAPANEPGEPMRIEGVVRDRAGQPASQVIVYAYHTNAQGTYPRDPRHPGLRHGLLRAWVRTGPDGRYRFDTIRPAGYPDTDIPVHVHMQVIEPGRCEYTIDNLMFDDDPRLTPARREQMASGRGGNGIVHATRDAKGTWHVTRDIVLGQKIPDYPARSR
jgi:protocatechuate 3,4-dioxygenase beta subunit